MNLDESVICLNDLCPLEVIDLSDSINETPQYSGSTLHLSSSVDNRESTRTRNKKKIALPKELPKIDLSKDYDTTQHSKENPRHVVVAPFIDLSNELDTDLEEHLDKTVEVPKRYSLDMNCPICFEKFSSVQPVATPCGHLFCADCIATALSKTTTCPKCRKPVQQNSLIPLYL